MENKTVEIHGFDLSGNTIYFSALEMNGIFSMDIYTGETGIETISGKYKMYNGYLYKCAVTCDDKIWFAPYAADDILVYDVKNKTCDYIDIPKLNGHGRRFVKFCGIYDYGECVILVPAEFPAILKVNKKNHAITVMNWEEKLLKSYPDFIEKNKWIGISARSYEVFEGKLYMFAADVFIKYEIDANRLELCRINNENMLISGIARYGDVFALADRNNGELVLWDEIENKIIRSFDLGHEGINADDDGGVIWLFNVLGGLVVGQSKDILLKFLDSSGMMHDIVLNIDRKEKDVVLSEAMLKTNRLIIPVYKQGKILIINTDDWSQQSVDMAIKNTNQLRILAQKEDFIQENSLFFDLNDLIEIVIQGSGKETSVKDIQSAGRTIYCSI